ncbi:fumarylacetoacetate hydrolase family protein [uncultured Propionivibrio sp.]|uniref:fumarylacetoacetate hydrolase family protein n=1 Tax=uncultured Propionivibrio sp. TaxID=426737 RepID=UPI0029BFC699|nr:fumarylacetoacetate hydrolase family protein [uncultured Propionivibrio sp.]
MTFVFTPAAQIVVPVVGSEAVFPVRRVYCVGQNYADHVAEMGGDGRNPPFFFSKPVDALVPGGGDVAYPPKTENYQHEIELVVAIGVGGRDIPVDKALDHVFGYAVGFDLTRRDLQALAKQKGQPWEMGKGMDQGGPIGAISPVGKCGHPVAGAIWMKVNGDFRQRGDLAQMTWKVPEIIANLSSYIALKPGDLIFTGTPSGVSAVVRGDVLEGGIAGLGELSVRLV